MPQPPPPPLPPSSSSSGGPSNKPPPPPQRPPPPSKSPPPPPPPPSSSSSSSRQKTNNTTFSEHDLPSVAKSGMTVPEERLKRRRTCRFLEEGGRILHLPRIPIATAMVFFHRFYAVHSFAEHDRFEVAVACLLLAAKTEESPKKLTVVISECWRLKHRAMRKTSSSTAEPGSNSPLPTTPSTSIDKNGYLDTKSEEYLKLKERILLLERVILHTIGFELSIDHPYKFLVEQIQRIMSSRQLVYVSPPSSSSGETSTASMQSKMTNELVQYAMNFANDSMHTSLCLQFPAKSIAQACVYMSAQYCRMRPTGQTWLDLLDSIDMDSLASICLQIMELIADKKGCDLKIFKVIRSDLEKMSNDRSEPWPKKARTS